MSLYPEIPAGAQRRGINNTHKCTISGTFKINAEKKMTGSQSEISESPYLLVTVENNLTATEIS